jgi:hypothetical protein
MSMTTEIEYICLTDWLEIQYKEADEDLKEYLNPEEYIQPYIEFENETHWLTDFIETHNNPWVNNNYPDFIHGYNIVSIFRPMFIEISESGDCARLYKHKVKE